ncbi:MAG: HAMP domain-containing sensor histidine kinase [Acidobacteria bacterium]|nr:HAMP domain-containing sensor histidine kinase [Acidobacteriota bacterium]
MTPQHPYPGAGRTPDPVRGDEDARRALGSERALADRPNVSIGLRIALTMLTSFLLVASVVVASMMLMSRVAMFQEFLERVSTYTLELEHARRYEKNYLLYGTNLDDAMNQAQAAHQLLRGSRDAVVALVGAPTFERMEGELDNYATLLERFGALGTRRDPPALAEHATIEHGLRRVGAQLLADANDVVQRERMQLHTAIRTSSLVSIGALLLVFVVMATMGYAMTRQIASPLRRFVGYTQRIAGGDYSPVQPARRYRDEFSDLAIAINRMVFRLRDREHRLERSSRMAAVGTLTAGIAHELNNPLNNISLNAEALLEHFDAYADAQKLAMIEDVVNQVERASGTVHNLLDFTRVEKPVFVPVSLAEVLAGARRLIGNEAQISHVDVALPDDLPMVDGNPRELQQVFVNLFLNAIQAMPNGGTITVRATRVDHATISIEIADTGLGIPEEDLGSIFDPFFTSKEVGVGTGLGLFVSYQTVKRHGGRIEVESRVGQGTVFTVMLPVPGSPGAVAARVSG